jgi:hypothetical protein
MTFQNLRWVVCTAILSILALASIPGRDLTTSELFSSSERFRTTHYELTGPTEAALVKEAGINAVDSAIGRIYFSDRILRARDLLDMYIEKSWQEFIARTDIKTSEIRGGSRFLSIDVTVDLKRLDEKLNELKFVYRPSLLPIFYIFLSETFDGSPVADPVGRKLLLTTIAERELRYLYAENADNFDIPASEKREKIIAPLNDADVSESSETLAMACREAQRNEVEVFVTGSIETKSLKSELVYFDDYKFVETTCTLMLVRSDTGEILKKVVGTRSAGNVDALQAVKASTEGAVEQVRGELFDAFADVWPKEILDKATVRIMVTRANEPVLAMLKRVLGGLSPDAEVYTRGQYGDVAVLTVSWNGEREALVSLLRRTLYPAFAMSFPEDNEIVLEIVD